MIVNAVNHEIITFLNPLLPPVLYNSAAPPNTMAATATTLPSERLATAGATFPWGGGVLVGEDVGEEDGLLESSVDSPTRADSSGNETKSP